jgi:hypothetical protein
VRAVVERRLLDELADVLAALRIDSHAVQRLVMGVRELLHRHRGAQRVVEALLVLGLVQRFLCRLEPHHRLLGDLLGEREGLGGEPIARHYPIDHADRLRGPRADRAAGEEHLFRLALPEFPRMAVVLDTVHAERDDRILERGVLARDDEIERPHEHQTAGDHLALHLRDGRLG